MQTPEYYQWWQRPDLRYQDQHLQFGGRRVADLANQLGTPAFVYSAARVRDNLARLRQALDAGGFINRSSILYAMKANRFAPLLTMMKQTGLCGIDACSPREVEHAVNCGFSPSEISFTATSLSREDVAILARYEGLVINCDTLHAIDTWGKLKPGTKIGIRVNPAAGISRESNDKLQYAGSATTKFGIYREQFPQALEIARGHNLTVNTIHFHTGCGYLTAQLPQLDQVIEQSQWFIDTAGTITHVNIGGGLGVPHVANDSALDLQQWAAVLRKHFGSTELHLLVEPGDYLVKDAGLLLVSKTYVEKKRETLFVGVNAGFNIAPEPAHYGLPFQPVPLHWDNSPSTPTVPTTIPTTVVGNINEALDVWYQDAPLPDLTNHEYLALINAGAYSASMASNHCMRGEFTETLLP